MKKNDIITLEITDISVDGFGIGRYENIAVFVPFAAVGDTLRVLIVKVLKNYCFGKIVEFIDKSTARIDPDCNVFSKCGGCCYRHISYEEEMRIKHKRVADAVERVGKLCAPINDIVGAHELYGYRNKAQYPLSASLNAGFYAFHSHRVVPCNDCRLQPQEFSPIIETICSVLKSNNIPAYDEIKHTGIVRHIYLRKAEMTGEIMASLVINSNRLKCEQQLVDAVSSAHPEVSTFVLNINKEKTNVILGRNNRTLYGKGYITDILCGVKIKLSPLSFYQVNRAMAERLYGIAAEYAEPDGKIVLDLYCGAGTIGLSMAKRAERIIGVEIVPDAVCDAKFNAKENGIENTEFICGSAPDAAKRLQNEGLCPDVVIVDPPRKGLTVELIDTITNDFSPERVVYVSCDPATLARDLKKFGENGYAVKEVQPVDLFPRTAHVESVALIINNKECKNAYIESSDK